MSDDMKVNLTRATALAAVSAVVKEARLGLFMSECAINDLGSIYWPLPAAGMGRPWHTYLTLAGRTNIGASIWTSVIVHYQSTPSEDVLPIKSPVLVAVRKPKRPDVSHHEYDYFSCDFGGSDFVIRPLEQHEYEKLAETK